MPERTDTIVRWLVQCCMSQQARLGLVAIASGGLVAASICIYQGTCFVHNSKENGPCSPFIQSADLNPKDRRSQNANLNMHERAQGASPSNIASPIERTNEVDVSRGFPMKYDEDLISEQLARTRAFLGDAGLQKVRSAFVVVIGCGGVGSHCAAALVRSGIGRIRLVDFDQVTLSSLNRHAVATLADVGTPKVSCLRRRLLEVAPWSQLECINEIFSKSSTSSHLSVWEDGQRPTFVVDAIDNIDSKVELLRHCYENSIPVISSMGAGCKSDPTSILIDDISRTTDDPLSRSTRRRLRSLKISHGIPAVFSTEKASPGKAQLLPLSEQEFAKGSVAELGVLPDFRARILPVFGTMPASFGFCLANYVILRLSGYPQEQTRPKNRDKMYEGILAALQSSEERLARSFGFDGQGLRLPVSQEDVGYLIEEVFRGCSLVSGLTTRLTLVRWTWTEDRNPQNFVNTDVPGQKSTRLKLSDLVCMTRDEALQHERIVLKPRQEPQNFYSPEILELVEAKQNDHAWYRSLAR